MPDLLIRNLDRRTHGELKRRAEREGISLQAYVSRLIDRHVERPPIDEWLEHLDLLPEVQPTMTGAEAVEAARDELP